MAAMVKTRRVLIWCLPTLILLSIGVFGLGLIPNRTSILSFVMILILGLIITRLIFLFFGRKAGVKRSSVVLWIIILSVVVFLTPLMPRTLHHSTKTEAVSKFEASVSILSYADFDSLDVGSVRSTEYHTFATSQLFFRSQSYMLICGYNEEEYEEALASIEDRYYFRTKQLGTGCFGDKNSEKMVVPYAMIGDDCFHFVAPGNGSSYPFYKECLLIMNNDVKHEIAYIAFSDTDLDVADDLVEFINQYCGWRYIHG